jgi:hypothetical protein
MIDSEGFASMYKGLQTALIGNIFSYGIYFFWFRYLKTKVAGILKRDNFSSIEMTAITALSGSISSIFSNPIWMINTRLAIQKKQS